MQDFLKSLEKNPFRDRCVTAFVKDKVDIRRMESKDELWGFRICHVSPPRLTTAWRMSEDPLMVIAGDGYRASEVRDRAFELQEEAVKNLRGNRKLTKAKMGDAMSAIKPTSDQTKVVAAILYHLKRIQTVCFDQQTKTVWTVPEDYRAWSNKMPTLWVDQHCERMLEGSANLGQWLSDRDDEGWTITWPVAEGTMEEIKSKAMHMGLVPRPSELGAKIKKEDWAKSLGRAEAIQKLMTN
jgi:hypothetical protein